MRATYFNYNNSIEINFYNNDGDIEILTIIEDAIMARAKGELDEDDAEACIKTLKSLMDLEESVQKMTKWKEEEDESGESDRSADV